MHTAGNRTETVEQIEVNVEAMMMDLQEILRIGQKRLWKVYEGRELQIRVVGISVIKWKLICNKIGVSVASIFKGLK